MKNDNLMHIRIDYEGAKQSKKDLLTTEISVIKAVQTLHAYKALKLQEYEAKAKLQAKIKEARLTLISLERILPKVKMAKELEEEHEEKVKEHKEKHVISKKEIMKVHEDPLESQLREIQEKLSRLG